MDHILGEVKGTVSPAQRCDCTASQQIRTACFYILLVTFGKKSLCYVKRFIYIEDSV